MSSDPAANAAMITAGADEALPKKAMLRSWLVALGNGAAASTKPAAAAKGRRSRRS